MPATDPFAPGVQVQRVMLRDLTTLKVGGPAELWTVNDSGGLADATQESFYMLGAGSNLLVSDRGVDRRVVRLGSAFNDIATFDGRPDLWLGAATPLPGLVRRAQRLGLSGLEGLLGIPAVLGGAVAMNAGTRFGTVADAVTEVELMRDGRLERHPMSSLEPGYRRTSLPADSVVVRARVTLSASSPERVHAAMAAVDAARRGQPKVKSAGCAFKNPEHGSAGRLIDEAGLKGLRVGGAMVSHEHGNFIVNLGAATSDDIVELLRLIRERVATPLETEWRLWGRL